MHSIMQGAKGFDYFQNVLSFRPFIKHSTAAKWAKKTEAKKNQDWFIDYVNTEFCGGSSSIIRVYEIGFLKSSELYLTLSLQGEFLVGNIARAALGSAFYGSKASSPRDCFGHQLWIIIKGSLWCFIVPECSLWYLMVSRDSKGFIRVP